VGLIEAKQRRKTDLNLIPHTSHPGEKPMNETLRDRYEIYVRCAKDLGWPIKTFEEWLAS